jgi:7-keto-8-aminopelargonate synthetase-like enzyme
VAGLRPRAFPESSPARGASNPRALQRSRHEQESRNCRRTERQAPIPGARALPRPSVLNFCANNYLGLANDPAWSSPPQDAASTRTASAWRRCASSAARSRCTSSSRRISKFLGTEDTILYGSCFDANGGLFETLLTEEDAIISDELNHASIIDGVRLCKASATATATTTWPTSRRSCRRDAAGVRFKLIATDGVFSMDGDIADLKSDLRPGRQIRRAGDGRRQPRRRLRRRARPRHAEHCGVMGRVDIITGTLGKALGGASGGFTSGHSGDHRPAAPALAALPVLQHARALHRRGLDQGDGAARE